MTAATTANLHENVDLAEVNRQLADADADAIVRWAADMFGNGLVMTSSFGAQAAVMLHLVTRVVPKIPIIAIDTGYLFPQTYQFAEQLTQRLRLNVRWYSASISAARQEALFGRLWEQGEEGERKYLWLNKIEPMQRALAELGATAWLAGLRASQTDHRATLRPVERQDGIIKIHPILRWTSRQVHEYLKTRDLPYHPLVEQGYRSIGDHHSTRPLGSEAGDLDDRTGRFRGLRQECGLHLPQSKEEELSRDSSGL